MKLSPQELFAGIEPRGIVIVAVSGGGDSMALLLLAHAWAQTGGHTLHAVTIDHGLRPEAAAEAAFVAGVCATLEIDHSTIAWDGYKPESGVAEAARYARYELIGEFAREIGATTVLVGHTADDQAETIAMRLERCAQCDLGRGLAGMARTSLFDGGLELVRPLISVTRRRLRQYLAEVSQSWIEDPSNEDDAFERVRVRRRLCGDEQARRRLAGFGEAMGRWRAVMARDTAALLNANVFVEPGPVFLADLQSAQQAPHAVVLHALQWLIAVSGGGEHLTPRNKIETLMAAPESLGRATLGGAVVEKIPGGLRLYRECRNLPSMRIEAGERAIWDGRLEIANTSRHALEIGPLSKRGLEDYERQRGRRLALRPRAALLSTACIRLTSGRIHLPAIETIKTPSGIETRLTAQAIEQFCPQTDMPALKWLRMLDTARQAFLLPRA